MSTDSEPSAPRVVLPRSRQLSLPSAALGATLRLDLALPDELEGAPTLYVLGGGAAFWIAAGMLRTMLWDSIVPPMLVVGVAPPRELVPPAPSAAASDFALVEPIDRMLQAIRTEVTPFVERSFPVDPARRALAGHSQGGFAVVRAFLDGDGHFCAYLASSPALWRFPGAEVIEERVRMRPSGRPTRLFLSVGALEQPDWDERGAVFQNVDRLLWLERLLEQRADASVSVRAVVLPDEGHTTALAPSFARGMQWLLGRTYPDAASRWAAIPGPMREWLHRARVPERDAWCPT